MSANLLDASALIHSLPSLLPLGRKRLESPHDAIAALVHTVFTTLGFRLVGVEESGPIGTFEGNVLPDAWNQHGPGNYTLRYKHEQSSLEFVVKVGKLGSRTLINSIALEVSIVQGFGRLGYLLIMYAERQSCYFGHLYERFYLSLILPS